MSDIEFERLKVIIDKLDRAIMDRLDRIEKDVQAIKFAHRGKLPEDWTRSGLLWAKPFSQGWCDHQAPAEDPSHCVKCGAAMQSLTQQQQPQPPLE